MPGFSSALCNSEAIAQIKNTRTVCSHRIEMPGWRGEELLRSTHDVGQLLRSSDRLFLPASGCPARTANQPAVRAGAAERRNTKKVFRKIS